MKASDLILRCYIKRTHGQWVAICIDLCLAAQGDTRREAHARLVSQIHDYVREALTVDRESADMLLTRKAPLSQQVEYLLILVAHKVRWLKARLGHVFKTALPLQVEQNCHA